MTPKPVIKPDETERIEKLPKKGDSVPRRPIPGSRFRSHFLVALITTMMVVAALSPVIGFLAGVIVNLVVHWYEIGMGI